MSASRLACAVLSLSLGGSAAAAQSRDIGSDALRGAGRGALIGAASGNVVRGAVAGAASNAMIGGMRRNR